MQLGSVLKQLNPFVAETKLAGNDAHIPSHSNDMVSRLVVAKLGSPCQAENHLSP